jgi:uncharacterized Fe-S radical SAM superfamily protein PflX
MKSLLKILRNLNKNMVEVIVYLSRDYKSAEIIEVIKGLTKTEIDIIVNDRFRDKWYYYDIYL